jgi:uncharacterized protein (TIGR02271 family)
VIAKDGLRGIVVDERPSGADGHKVIVQFEDGRRVIVPEEALVPRDGVLYLSLGADQLDRGEIERGDEKIVLPVVQEELDVHKRIVETGGVRLRKIVREREEIVEEPLLREEVHVERVPVNRVIDSPVEMRQEGDTMIVPVLEEVVVVDVRLVVREELHITRRREETHAPQRVTLRREEVVVETPSPVYERREDRVVDPTAGTRVFLSRLAAFIYLMFGILIAMIGVRIILLLIGANPASGFASFIYGVTNPFLAPFFGLTNTPPAAAGVLEIPSIIAMFVYAFVAWVIVYLLRIVFAPSRSTSPTKRVSTYRRER